MVSNTINMDNPTISIIKFAGSTTLSNKSLKSTRGFFARLSTMTKTTVDTTPMTTNVVNQISADDKPRMPTIMFSSAFARGGPLPEEVSNKVIERRRDIIAIANVTAPRISMRLDSSAVIVPTLLLLFVFLTSFLNFELTMTVS